MENCLAIAMEEYHREEKGEWEWERQLGGRIKRTPGASCVVVIMAEPMAGVKKGQISYCNERATPARA